MSFLDKWPFLERKKKKVLEFIIKKNWTGSFFFRVVTATQTPEFRTTLDKLSDIFVRTLWHLPNLYIWDKKKWTGNLFGPFSVKKKYVRESKERFLEIKINALTIEAQKAA